MIISNIIGWLSMELDKPLHRNVLRRNTHEETTVSKKELLSVFLYI